MEELSTQHSALFGTAEERRSLLDTLERLRCLTEGVAPSRMVRRIDEESGKLENLSLYVVVLGQFKRGKTSLINAMLGEDLLPTAIVPVTSAITLVRGSHRRFAVAVYTDGQRQEIDPEDLADVLSERGNPGNVKGVLHVEIGHPSPLLREGLVLVDTPGIGSIDFRNTHTTREFLPRIDAGVLVLSPDPPITELERDFFRELALAVPKLLIVMNKIDAYENVEWKGAIEYLSTVIKTQIPGLPVDILPVSSRGVRAAGGDSADASGDRTGIPDLRRRLSELQRIEGTRLVLGQSRKRITALAQEAVFAASLEMKATLLPVSTLQENARKFRSYQLSVRRQAEDVGILLNGKVAILNRLIGERLDQFSLDAAPRVKSAIRRWAVTHGELPPPKFRLGLQEVLTDALRDEFDRWRSAYEKEVLNGFGTIAAEYVDRANSFIRRLREFAAGLFELDIPELGNAALDGDVPDFRYKTTDDLQFLEIDPVTIASPVIPRVLVRKILTRRALESAEDKVQRNAGRLRSEYVAAIDEATRRLQGQLHDRFGELLEQVEGLLDRVAASMALERETTRPRAVGIQRRLDSLRKLLDGESVLRPGELGTKQGDELSQSNT